MRISDMPTDTKWSKGPWRVLEWADEKKGFIAIVGSREPPEHVCDVFPFGKRAEGQSMIEHEANAHLISAAPELYAAVRELLRVREWSIEAGAEKGPFSQDVIRKFAEMQIPAVDQAYAALAKAEGRSTP